MNILWLDTLQCQDINRVGTKAANLSRLTAKYRVPIGFCITTTTRQQEGPDKVGTSDSLLSLLLGEELNRAYQELAQRVGTAEPRVAVRSSAVDEDGLGASFAGQHETYLNVSGINQLADAVTRCWMSARTERAQKYRQQQGLSQIDLKLAALVQELVPADVSAVAFSANPITGNQNEVMINASWGFGESVVNGSVNPDTFIVRKSDLAVVERDITQKMSM